MTKHRTRAVGAGVTYFAEALATPHGIIGLAGQVLFGLMPVIAGRP